MSKRVRYILDLLIFLSAFIGFTIILYFAYKPLVEPYNKLLINLVPSWILNVKQILAFSVKGNDIFLFARNPSNILMSFRVDGLFLHANMISVFALFLATFKIKWKKRLVYLFWSMILLFLTHLFHLILNCIVVTPYWVFPSGFSYSQSTVSKVAWFLTEVRTFFEQIGRMIFPFFLWCIFCLGHLMGKRTSECDKI